MSQESTDPGTSKATDTINRGARPKANVGKTLSNVLPSTEEASGHHLTRDDINRIRELLNLPELSSTEIKNEALISRYFISRDDFGSASRICINSFEKSKNLSDIFTLCVELKAIAEHLECGNELKIIIKDFLDRFNNKFEESRKLNRLDFKNLFDNYTLTNIQIYTRTLSRGRVTALTCRDKMNASIKFELAMYGLETSEDLCDKLGICVELDKIVEKIISTPENDDIKAKAEKVQAFLNDVKGLIDFLMKEASLNALCGKLETVGSKEFGYVFHDWAKKKGHAEIFFNFYFNEFYRRPTEKIKDSAPAFNFDEFLKNDIQNKRKDFGKDIFEKLSSEYPTDNDLFLKVKREFEDLEEFKNIKLPKQKSKWKNVFRKMLRKHP